MLMKFMGAEILIKETTNIGRIDAVLQTPTHIYIVELKLGKSATEAIEQIEQRQYAQKYELLNKPIVCVGLAFDATAKNIVEHIWQPLSARMF